MDQSKAVLYYNNIEVGKVYFYSNIIGTKILVNVALELFESPCFEANTFVTGQVFYTSDDRVLVEKNKILSFKGISTGGSFTNKNITVIVKTDETLIRLVTIIVEDSDCKCNN